MDDTATTAAPTHTFRTYASDLAKMGGKASDARPVPAPKKPTAPVVSNPAAPKPAATHPAAAAPVATPPPAPKVPYEPPPATIIPKAPSTDESREAVLARLKARTAPPAEKAPEPAPAYVIPKAPSTDEKRDEVLARLKAKVAAGPTPAPVTPAPVTPPTPATPKPTVASLIEGPSPIHTYKSDFSEKAKRENASPITILAAEQNAAAVAPKAVPESSKNRTLLVAGSVLLILAAGISVFAAYAFVTGRPLTPLAPLVPSLVFGDRYEEIVGNGAELRAELMALGGDLNQGDIAIAYVTVASSSANGKAIMVPAQGGALIEALGLTAPSILLRNIEPESTVGVLREESGAYPFFVLRVSSYERTFAGMLDWEPDMRADLASFYPAPETTSASAPLRAPLFRDEVIDNHDVRVLRDGEGNTLLIYGYRDKETLVLARSVDAFRELLRRLSATAR